MVISHQTGSDDPDEQENRSRQCVCSLNKMKQSREGKYLAIGEAAGSPVKLYKTVTSPETASHFSKVQGIGILDSSQSSSVSILSSEKSSSGTGSSFSDSG